MRAKSKGFVVRSAFRGADENFVISDSEGKSSILYQAFSNTDFFLFVDSKVYIWQKGNGTPSLYQAIKEGVSWNPADPCLSASAGNDRKIRFGVLKSPLFRFFFPGLCSVRNIDLKRQ